MILKNVQMKNKQIAQRQWEWRVLPFFYGFYPEGQSLVDLTGRISASHLNMHLCRLVCFVIWGCKNVYVHFLRGDGRGLVCASEGRKGEKKNGEMDEGSSGALGVLIIHHSVVGSELAISSWLYPCLMIWAVLLSLNLQLLWPNKEKREGKEGVLQQ